MAKNKPQKLKARLPKGFVDREAQEIHALEAMLERIKKVYQAYGFDPIETPMFEYTDALGKFLPDSDRPNEGVFSIQDEDEQWLSLRYDLTAPLARYVAEQGDSLVRPFRSYRAGYVFRNEKPGPGRFRQFMQFDADCVGAPAPSADAEMCMMMADAMDAVGLKGQYRIRVNSRKLLDGVMAAIEIPEYKKLDTLRALDKADKFPIEEVDLLLTSGRKDPSGDFTKGVGLTKAQSSKLLSVFAPDNAYKAAYEKEDGTVGYLSGSPDQIYLNWEDVVRAYDKIGLAKFFGKPSENQDLIALLNVQVIAENNPIVLEGIIELLQILRISQDAGYHDRIQIDPSVVRGLEYYTGAVFECELTFEVPNEKGEIVRFGSVAGGGRYDGLVSRFGGVPTPATGFSIGVSRLMTALKNLGKLEVTPVQPPVIVCVMDKDVESLGCYMGFAQTLRQAGIRAEMFQGNPKQFGKQLQYADRRGSVIAVIQGSEERANGEVQLKDLIVGAELAKDIADRAEWVEERPGQVTVKEADLVAEVQKILARYQGGQNG